MVTTNQKPPVDTQKLKRKENKHTSKENHQTTREETERRRKRNKRNPNWRGRRETVTVCR